MTILGVAPERIESVMLADLQWYAVKGDVHYNLADGTIIFATIDRAGIIHSLLGNVLAVNEKETYEL